MRDFFGDIDKRYNDIYSYGGKVERSFWKNVGDIVNRRSFFEIPDKGYSEILKRTEKIMRGEDGEDNR